MINQLKHLYRSVKYKQSNYVASNKDNIKLFWWNEKVNLGDAINLEVVKKLSKKEVEWVPHNYALDYNTCIGSVLQLANNNASVWGSGYISEAARSPRKPKHVHAVRGPLTRKLLQQQGVLCPEVFGDPALLAPLLFPIKTEKKYKLGIIPHFVDKESSFFKRTLPDDVKVIDIETDNIVQFLTEMCECEKIISSSLHGIILADAYSIPSIRVKFSNAITGGDFKFNDYSLSVSRELVNPIYLDQNYPIAQIYNENFDYFLNIDTTALLQACPFKG
ncbi:MAG: polysaccharide pyruvyl transferase family protein [Thalassotalea sp.]